MNLPQIIPDVVEIPADVLEMADKAARQHYEWSAWENGLTTDWAPLCASFGPVGVHRDDEDFPQIRLRKQVVAGLVLRSDDHYLFTESNPCAGKLTQGCVYYLNPCEMHGTTASAGAELIFLPVFLTPSDPLDRLDLTIPGLTAKHLLEDFRKTFPQIEADIARGEPSAIEDPECYRGIEPLELTHEHR